MCLGAGGGFGSMCRGAGGVGSMCRGTDGGVGSGVGSGAGAGAGPGAGAGDGAGIGSSFFPLRVLPIDTLILLAAFFNMAIFFDLDACFEPVYSGSCCIGCISGAGWTGSYLGADAGINGTDGGPGFGPGFGPPLFPLGESILYVSGFFDFLVLIVSTSILT